MNCPICAELHEVRPIKCLQSATLDHVGRCGISTEHSADCSLKILNDYVAANPLWNKKKKK